MKGYEMKYREAIEFIAQQRGVSKTMSYLDRYTEEDIIDDLLSLARTATNLVDELCDKYENQ